MGCCGALLNVGETVGEIRMISEEIPNSVTCPYCNSGKDDHCELADHPYPYKRGKSPHPSIDFLQLIRLIGCNKCGNHFYYSMRLGSDMGMADCAVYCQTYKQGHYRYREGDEVIMVNVKLISKKVK